MALDENVLKFNEKGLLPPGCHEITLPEIKSIFVDGFPDSRTRQSRFECFMEFYKDLLDNVKSCICILIDGSFVENKINPCDVDLVIVVDYEQSNEYERNYLNIEFDYNELIKKDYLILKDKVDKGEEGVSNLLKLDFYNYGCDIHFFFKYPINHPLYNHNAERLDYWRDIFGKNREEMPKGFLNLTVDYSGDLNG